MKPVKLSELISAIEGQSEENVTRVDLKTGEVVMVDEFVLHALEEDDEEALSDLADWQKPELEIARAMVSDSGGVSWNRRINLISTSTNKWSALSKR